MNQSTTSLSKVRLLQRVWRRTGRRVLDATHATARAFRNALRRLGGRADYARWNSPEGLEVWWVARTELIASLIPANSRVIEFGAGRRQLEHYLPDGCTYTPSDLVTRGPGTVVCDLNQRPLPNLSQVAPQVGVFGGVLEYIRDVPVLVRWLVDEGVTTCVASFDPVPAGLGLIGRYRESFRRSYYGYMNSLTEKDLLRGFETAGFVCVDRRTWTKQIILRFQKSS